jgi:hypothetical protein
MSAHLIPAGLLGGLGAWVAPLLGSVVSLLPPPLCSAFAFALWYNVAFPYPIPPPSPSLSSHLSPPPPSHSVILTLTLLPLAINLILPPPQSPITHHSSLVTSNLTAPGPLLAAASPPFHPPLLIGLPTNTNPPPPRRPPSSLCPPCLPRPTRHPQLRPAPPKTLLLSAAASSASALPTSSPSLLTVPLDPRSPSSKARASRRLPREMQVDSSRETGTGQLLLVSDGERGAGGKCEWIGAAFSLPWERARLTPNMRRSRRDKPDLARSPPRSSEACEKGTVTRVWSHSGPRAGDGSGVTERRARASMTSPTQFRYQQLSGSADTQLRTLCVLPRSVSRSAEPVQRRDADLERS